MLSEEVVVGDEENREADGSVEILEATASTGMELVRAIQTFNQLLERSKVFGLFVLVFQADNDALLDPVDGFALGVEVDGMDGGAVRGKTIGDKSDALTGRDGSNGFVECDLGVFGAPIIREMVSVDGTRYGADGEPGVVPFATDADVGFVGGKQRIDQAFVMGVELVAEHGSMLGVVKNGLVRDGDLKNVSEDMGRLSGAGSVGDVESQDKAESV